VPNNYDLNIISLAVQEAEAIGIPQKDLIPVYQAFGGGRYSTYILPTATQEQQILSEWGPSYPIPPSTTPIAGGVQVGDTALPFSRSSPLTTPPCRRACNDPALQRRDEFQLCQGRLAEL
jgi:hypothetical protein